jgi:hypothetical protein
MTERNETPNPDKYPDILSGYSPEPDGAAASGHPRNETPTEQMMEREPWLSRLWEWATYEPISTFWGDVTAALQEIDGLRNELSTLREQVATLTEQLREAREDERELLDSRERALAESARLREGILADAAIEKTAMELARDVRAAAGIEMPVAALVCVLRKHLRTHIDDRKGE